MKSTGKPLKIHIAILGVAAALLVPSVLMGCKETADKSAENKTPAAEKPAATETKAEKTETETAAPATGGKMHVVKAAGVRFLPMFVYINPGDKVSFENMPSHNVQTVDPLIPEGQEKIKTELGDNVTLTFNKVGLVVYKCFPHWGNRMGGIIVVGKPDNPEKIIDDYLALTDKPEYKDALPARGLLKKLKKDMKKKGLI